jgi:hypothetical protein
MRRDGLLVTFPHCRASAQVALSSVKLCVSLRAADGLRALRNEALCPALRAFRSFRISRALLKTNFRACYAFGSSFPFRIGTAQVLAVTRVFNVKVIPMFVMVYRPY